MGIQARGEWAEETITLAALVRRSPLSPTQMLRTSFCTLISLMGFDCFFSDACRNNKTEKKKTTPVRWAREGRNTGKERRSEAVGSRRNGGRPTIGALPLVRLHRNSRGKWRRREGGGAALYIFPMGHENPRTSQIQRLSSTDEEPIASLKPYDRETPSVCGAGGTLHGFLRKSRRERYYFQINPLPG